jgi:hypothetical protein
VQLVWQEASQNFVIGGAAPQTSVAARRLQAGALGVLENPADLCSRAASASSRAGCAAPGTDPAYRRRRAAAGRVRSTSRLDTVGICGDADNGFGRLINWSLLGNGTQ